MSADAPRIYFQRAADQLDLSEAMRRLLLTAKREVQVQIPVELDSGRWPPSLATASSTTTPAGR